MKIAKVVKIGRSQAIRLPKEFHVDEDRVERHVDVQYAGERPRGFGTGGRIHRFALGKSFHPSIRKSPCTLNRGGYNDTENVALTWRGG